MKLVTWHKICNYAGVAVHHPSRSRVLGLAALGLVEIRFDERGRVWVDAAALDAAARTLDRGVEEARQRGLTCGARRRPSRALALAGLVAAGEAINSRPARRARKARKEASAAAQMDFFAVAVAVGGKK